MKKISRRHFLIGGGIIATSGLLSNPAQAFIFKNTKYKLMVPELFYTRQLPPQHSKNVVIGSGFGGAISALRLSQAGEEVTLLERGFKWPNSDIRGIFSDDMIPDGRAFWFKNKVKMIPGHTAYMDSFGGVLDATEYKNMTIWRGACVGGGSVIFTGVMIQPEKLYFDDIFKGSVDYDEMNNIYYPRVRKMLNLSSMPNDIYTSGPFGHSRVWDDQARKAGYTPTSVDSLFNWQVIRKELRLQSRPSATVGLSNHGNSNGAKFDLNQNYLKWAQATGKTTVYSGQEVLHIHHDGQHYHLAVINRSPDGTVLNRYDISCERLFLAAGSVGSTELLVKSKALGGLSKLNDEVGKGWGSNGDAIVVRSFSPIKGLVQGAACASKIHDPTRGGMPVTLENWYAPSVPINLGVIGSLGMVYDDYNRGHFTYNKLSGKVELNWRKDGNADAFSALRIVNNHIAHASHSLPGKQPFIDDVNGMNWTAHPLGGAVIGQATDNYGQINEYPNLFVMDGALIPGSTGSVNPSLTISALAERNIEYILNTII